MNALLLKIAWFTYTGILLGVLLFSAVTANFVKKYIDNKNGKKVEFLLPDNLANKVKEVDIGIQYESSVVAMSFLLVGILAFNIYSIFFSDVGLAMKIFITFNSLCGFILLSSMLVTSYQQLMSYRSAISMVSAARQMQNENETDNQLLKGGQI
jgi:hypothetical protein